MSVLIALVSMLGVEMIFLFLLCPLFQQQPGIVHALAGIVLSVPFGIGAQIVTWRILNANEDALNNPAPIYTDFPDERVHQAIYTLLSKRMPQGAHYNLDDDPAKGIINASCDLSQDALNWPVAGPIFKLMSYLVGTMTGGSTEMEIRFGVKVKFKEVDAANTELAFSFENEAHPPIINPWGAAERAYLTNEFKSAVRGRLHKTEVFEELRNTLSMSGIQLKDQLAMSSADEKEVDKEFQDLCARAEAKEPDAVYKLALILKGASTPDYERCYRLFKFAAKSGHVPATFELSRAVLAGQGTNRDEARAFQLCEFAAKSNHVPAMHALGDHLLNGVGVTADLQRGARYFFRAAREGHPGGAIALAKLIGEQRVPAPEPGKGADYWLKQAAFALDDGVYSRDLNAKYEMAMMYKVGQGVPKNDGEYVRLLRSAADAGHEKARQELSLAKQNRIPGADAEAEQDDPLLAELNTLIGLGRVKQDVAEMINFLRVQKKRAEKGMQTTNVSRHLVFYGNPGTGKTTVARIIARLYASMGILKKGHMIEADRSKMVGEYVGHTAVKVAEIVDRAKGGVLFIDEAYTLAPSGERDFGQEAIDTLLKLMEDYRESLVVIVAGYPDLMKQFLGSNPGMQSRFNKYIYFDDYDPQDMLKIFIVFAKGAGFSVSTAAREKLLIVLADLYQHRDATFGNGRDVRNLFESTIARQANRLASVHDLHTAKLSEISVEDIPDSARAGIGFL